MISKATNALLKNLWITSPQREPGATICSSWTIWGFLNRDRLTEPQWLWSVFSDKMYENGLNCAQKLPKVFYMYRREYRDKLSFKDIFLPFGGQLAGDNRWIKLAELISWDELEDDYAAHSSARGLVLRRSHFVWRWGL